MPWSKKKPTPPRRGRDTDNYFYYDPNNYDRYVLEVWPNRDISRFNGWWWYPKVEPPDEDPPEE